MALYKYCIIIIIIISWSAIVAACCTELIESCMYLYQATRDPFLLEVAVEILESLEHNTKTACGYATVRRVFHLVLSCFLTDNSVRVFTTLFDQNLPPAR